MFIDNVEVLLGVKGDWSWAGVRGNCEIPYVDSGSSELISDHLEEIYTPLTVHLCSTPSTFKSYQRVIVWICCMWSHIDYLVLI